MGEDLQRYEFRRFDGGYYVAGDPRNIADNELSTLENMLPSRYGGALHSRLGWYAVSAHTPDITVPTWMYYWPEEDKYVVVQKTGGVAEAWTWVMYHIDSDGQNKTTFATTGIGVVPATTYALPHCVSFGYGVNNRLIIAFGGTLREFAVGGAIATIAGAGGFQASYVIVRFDQIFACDDYLNTARVWYCDTLDRTDWVGGNAGYYDVSAGDGGTVKVIYDYLGDLWIFKGGGNPSIWLSSGTPSGGYTNTIYKKNSPNIYRYSPVTTAWGLCFASRGAISLLLGGGEGAALVDISGPVKSTVHGKMSSPEVGEGVMAYSAKFNTLFLKIETTGAGYTATSMLMCRLLGRQAMWAEYKGPQITCPIGGDYLVGLNESNSEQLMCYGEDYNNALAGIVLADFDTAWRPVVWTAGTKETDCGSEAIRKNARSAICDVNVDGTITQTATGEIFVDGGAVATDTITIDGQGSKKGRQRTNILFDTIRALWTGSQVITTPVAADDYDKLTKIGKIGFDYRFMHEARRTQV